MTGNSSLGTPPEFSSDRSNNSPPAANWGPDQLGRRNRAKAFIGCWAKPIQPAYSGNCSGLDAFKSRIGQVLSFFKTSFASTSRKSDR
jgi:hypothetical protein